MRTSRVDRVRLNLWPKPLRKAHSERNIRILANRISRVPSILLRPLLIVRVVVSDLPAPGRCCRAHIHNPRGRLGGGGLEDGGGDERDEEEVPEMVGAELGLEAVFCAHDGEGLGDCGVVDDDLGEEVFSKDFGE